MVSNSPEQNKRLKAHYLRNKKYYAEKRDKLRVRNRKFVLSYLQEHPCSKCGESDPVVLDFDHLGNKNFTISMSIKSCYSLTRIQGEMDRCQVLCSNCHRRKTAQDFGWFRNTPR